MKKVLVVDDSALMRRVLCDIIESDGRFKVEDRASNGLEALELLERKYYDVVVLDVNMPQMDGISLLRELQKRKISVKVMMASTDTKAGAKTTLDALELGALDFVHKPDTALQCRNGEFQMKLLRVLESVVLSKAPVYNQKPVKDTAQEVEKVLQLVKKHNMKATGQKVVAIASSTGGPKALQAVIPNLPENLAAPVVIVQHMPPGFTASLAERLNSLSAITVTEAQEGDVLENGHVYLAMGGKHLNIIPMATKSCIHYTDEPTREGVKPCANYMYESLSDSRYEQVVCVVMTGMGADGTVGIKNLKTKKSVHVIAQEQESCTVYGMPRSVVKANLADQVVPLNQLAQEIIMNVGVI